MSRLSHPLRRAVIGWAVLFGSALLFAVVATVLYLSGFERDPAAGVALVTIGPLATVTLWRMMGKGGPQ